MDNFSTKRSSTISFQSVSNWVITGSIKYTHLLLLNLPQAEASQCSEFTSTGSRYLFSPFKSLLCEGVRRLQCPSRWSYTTDPFLNELCKPRASTSEEKPRLNSCLQNFFLQNFSKFLSKKSPSHPTDILYWVNSSPPGHISNPRQGRRELFVPLAAPVSQNSYCYSGSPAAATRRPVQPCPNQPFLGVIPLNLKGSPQSSCMCLSQVRLSSPWYQGNKGLFSELPSVSPRR